MNITTHRRGISTPETGEVLRARARVAVNALVATMILQQGLALDAGGGPSKMAGGLAALAVLLDDTSGCAVADTHIGEYSYSPDTQEILPLPGDGPAVLALNHYNREKYPTELIDLEDGEAIPVGAKVALDPLLKPRSAYVVTDSKQGIYTYLEATGAPAGFTLESCAVRALKMTTDFDDWAMRTLKECLGSCATPYTATDRLANGDQFAACLKSEISMNRKQLKSPMAKDDYGRVEQVISLIQTALTRYDKFLRPILVQRFKESVLEASRECPKTTHVFPPNFSEDASREWPSPASVST